MQAHNMKRFPLLPLAALTLALGACSDGAPSSADIEQALKSGMAKAASRAQGTDTPVGAAMSQIMSKVEIHDVKNLGCTKDEAGSGFRCKVEMDVTSPFAGRQKSTRTLHLVKDGTDWKIAR